MILDCRNLSRIVWVHIREGSGEAGKSDLLAKMYLHTGKRFESVALVSTSSWRTVSQPNIVFEDRLAILSRTFTP